MKLKLVLTAVLALSSLCAAQDVLVKSGETVAFMGDSITQQGWQSTAGYVKLVVAGLENNGVTITPVPAGISGHKSNQMLDRLDKDVLSKKPQWMTLSCGVNDVWHGERGVPLDQYKKNIRAIVERCQAANVKVMILTATMITEDADAENNKKLAAYNDFLHELAKEKKLPLADLYADMSAAVKAGGGGKGKPNLLTTDGVHMNAAGNVVMATGVLKAFGLSDEQIAKAKKSWLDIPNAVELKVGLTLRQYERLKQVAESQGKTVQQYINDEAKKLDAQE
jgi:lysophospholipase L1-like esterase